MDFDQYVAARYGRLIEHAVSLGCSGDEAASYVDLVLREQRKQIRRAEDPDPLVHEALDQAINGPPPRSRRTAPVVAAALLVVAVGVGVVATYRPKPDHLPSLFALNGTQAEDLLESRGFHVTLEQARSCEPPGLVVDSDPPSGGKVRTGARVTVRTSVLAGSHCEPAYPRRLDAWEFVLYALDRGPAPEFASAVDVVVDGREPVRLTGDVAGDLLELDDVTTPIADAARQTRDAESGLPRLVVTFLYPPESWCGVDLPENLDGRSAVRLKIDAAPPDSAGCPLTVDLYRTDSLIDAVVLYTPKGR